MSDLTPGVRCVRSPETKKAPSREELLESRIGLLETQVQGMSDLLTHMAEHIAGKLSPKVHAAWNDELVRLADGRAKDGSTPPICAVAGRLLIRTPSQPE